MTAWVYGTGGATPGGDDKDVQFNNNGSFSGSALLITDGSGSLSASANISASAFYGDGSNLTGLTASAVNVADGPEFSLQFRRDHPITGEISGSAALIFLTASNTLSGTQAQFTAITASTIVGGSPIVISSSGTTISGNVLICNGTASISNLSGCSPIQVHSPIQLQSGLSLSFNGATETAKITNNGSNLDINSPSNIILNGPDGVGVGTSSPAASIHISSSAANAALFRVDSEQAADALLFVTSSGRVGIGTSDPGIGGSSDTVLDVQGHLTIGKAGTAYIFNNNDSDTHIKFGGSVPPGTDGMSFIVGGKRMLMLDENGEDKVTLGSAGTDVVYVSGSLTVSASAANGEDIFVGSGTSRTIGVLVDGGDDFFEIGHDAGAITLSASAGVEFIAGSAGVGSFGSTISVYNDQEGSNTVVSLTNDGAISGSTKLESGGTLTVAGNSVLNGNLSVCAGTASIAHLSGCSPTTFHAPAIFNDTVNLNAAVTSSHIILSTTPAGTGAGLHLSASNPAFGPGQVYGQMFFGSGSYGGSGWTGTSISLSDFGSGEEFEFRAKFGGTTVRADDGDATLRATAGEVILSGSAGIVGQTEASFNAGLTVNNVDATINSNLVANGNVTLGNASGDGITIKAGSITQTDNPLTYRLKDGENGLSGNGALMFFTGSGGDFMKFHTSGSAKGIVFDQQTYLAKGGGLSGSAAGPGSYLALDGDNKIVITSSSGGSTASPGGVDTNIQFNQNGSFAGNAGLKYSGTGSVTLSGSDGGNQQSKLIFGDNENTKLEALADGSDAIFRISSEDRGIDISGSHDGGIALYGGDGGDGGVMLHGANGLTLVNAAGNGVAVSLGQAGTISGSSHLSAGGDVTVGARYFQSVSDVKTANFNIDSFQVFLVDTTGSAITGTLPAVASSNIGLTYTVKDVNGNANTNNIHITSSTQRIDNGLAAKIQTDFGAMTLMAVSGTTYGYSWSILSTNG